MQLTTRVIQVMVYMVKVLMVLKERVMLEEEEEEQVVYPIKSTREVQALSALKQQAQMTFTV